jgi:hypothetical protein
MISMRWSRHSKEYGFYKKALFSDRNSLVVRKIRLGWHLGAGGSSGAPDNFFTGLIDEVAFFSEVIDLPTLPLHASPLANENTGVNSGGGNLLVHFPLDEGQGTESEDYGPTMTGMGTVNEATFSIIAFRQVTRPHEFSPSRRVVNLTNSSTAVTRLWT